MHQIYPLRLYTRNSRSQRVNERSTANRILICQAVRFDPVTTVGAFRIGCIRKRTVDEFEALLPQADVRTATVFLEQGEFGPALWWYVERTGAARDVIHVRVRLVGSIRPSRECSSYAYR